MRRIGKIRVDRENGTKFCPDCSTSYPLSDFSVRKSGTLYTYCKGCNGRRAREWSAKNKERKAATNLKWLSANRDRVRTQSKANHLKRTYGLTMDEVAAKLAGQDARCALCDTEVTIETLVIDHDHGTGKVRDVLCNRCNISLAPLERPGFLERAMAYLERHRSES